ncbi:MAG: cytochrome P450, partial [Deltaproteobacteria bacterium]|nr:cytochrome P450 [Deltaproteobacteria bacterium]
MTARSSLPPGPRWTLPATLRLIRDPYAYTAELRAKHGDVVSFPSLNGKLVMVMTPALAETVLRTPPSKYGPFAAEALASFAGPRALLVTDGATHRADRKLLTPPFHGRRMKAYAEQMQLAARSWFERSFVPGETVRFLDVTTELTMDVILGSVFGVVEGPTFDEGRQLLEALTDISPLILFSKRAHTRWFGGYRSMVAARERFRAWLKDRVAEARARGDEGEDILALMLAARYDDDTAMTEEEIESQLITLLFAGHETTAIALAWAAHWLGRHPDMLQRLRDELDALGPDPTPDTVAQLPYLKGICDETLRLHPILTEVLRLLKEPMELGGYTLPA